ncbi:MAG: hypothetical protein HQL42_15415 [Alphaproteobacteria bacterium]|nr:hypothetical protein [Alphaproteobacteria bacterium]
MSRRTPRIRKSVTVRSAVIDLDFDDDLENDDPMAGQLVIHAVPSLEAEEALSVAAIHMRTGMAPVEALLLTAEAMFGSDVCAKARAKLVEHRGFTRYVGP